MGENQVSIMTMEHAPMQFMTLTSWWWYISPGFNNPQITTNFKYDVSGVKSIGI